MKKRLSAVVCIMLILILTACSANLEELDKAETYPASPGALETIYTSMDQLAQDADVIAEVTVLSQEVVPLDALPQTHSLIRIDKLLKGDPIKDNVLTVIEEGCDTKDQTVILGVPPMKQGETYILHLQESEGKHYILGAFQGKFIIKKDYVFQQSTEDVKMQTYFPLTKEEFLKIYS